MASEKLVIELWEIVQKENNEKISYSDFENDLNKALNLSSDEMDRALSLMLSQAEINPQILGQSKGGSFILSSSFTSSIISTVKYENQFVPGTKEYDIRKNAKDNREFIDIAGVLIAGSVIDKMIDNFQELSTKERDSLLGNIAILSLDQRIRINTATINMIMNAKKRDTEGVVEKQLNFAEKLAKEAKLLQEALKGRNVDQLRDVYGQIDIPAEQISGNEFMKLVESTRMPYTGNSERKSYVDNDAIENITHNGSTFQNPYNRKQNFGGKEDFSEFIRTSGDEGRIISLDGGFNKEDRMEYFAEQFETLIIQVEPNVYAVNNNGTYQFVTLDGKEISQENLKEFMYRIRAVLKDVMPPEKLVEYLEKFEQSRTSAAATLAHDATRTLDIQDAVRRKDEVKLRQLLESSSVGREIQEATRSSDLLEVGSKLIEGQISIDVVHEATARVAEVFLKDSIEKLGLPSSAVGLESISLNLSQKNIVFRETEEISESLEEKYLKEIEEAKEKIDLIGTPESKMQAYKTYRILLENAKDKANEGELLDTETILDYISTER